MSDSLDIAKTSLRSRVVRDLIGERTIDIFKSLTQNESENAGTGVLSWLIGLGQSLIGFLFNVAGRVVSWVLKNIWDIIVQATFEVINFDWNQTDAAIQAQIEANNIAIAAVLGQFAGSGAVWIASITIAGLASIEFPVLGGEIALKLAEEGGEEIRGQLVAFLSSMQQSLTRNYILGAFLTLRKLKLFGLAPVSEQREPWTIASAIESRIEQIGDAKIRAFINGFLQGAGQSLIEVGYVVSYAIEDYYRAAKLAQKNQLGKGRAVQIQPDTRVEGENITLTGPQNLVMGDIQTTIATHQMIHNRDVGQIVGQPAEDWLRAKMQRRKLTVIFKSKKKPPYVAFPGEERIKEVCYTVPDAKAELTWTELKAAAHSWTWGRFRATANLDNGRQMAVYGASESEAERKLRELHALSTANILTLSVSEELDRHPNLKKRSTEMYPAYATLLIRRSTAEATGTNDLSGNNYKDEHYRVDLWPDVEPEGTPILG